MEDRTELSKRSELQLLILQTVNSIPFGKVSSYGKVAELCGYPGYGRYVGKLLKQLPSGTSVPWHRVISSSGKISLPKDGEAYINQLSRLGEEGVEVENDKVRMHLYGWPD